MKKRILYEINRCNFEAKEGRFIRTSVWNEVYTYSMLKSSDIKKNKFFSEVHQLDSRDEILLVFQNGMSEKDSLLITENMISIAQSNWFSKNILTKMLWTDIKDITLVNHSLLFMFNNGVEKNFNVDEIFAKNIKKSEQLAKLLQKIRSIANGEKESLQDTVSRNIEGFNFKFNPKRLAIIIGIFLLFIVFGSIIIFSPVEKGKSVYDKYISNFFEKDERKNPPVSLYDTIWNDSPKEGFKEIIVHHTTNVFNEPFSLTMESKSFWKFRGATKITIPIEIPQKTNYWIYRLILSNALIESKEDTELIKEVDLGLKDMSIGSVVAYDITKGILNRISAPTKLKPYVNVYFIPNEEEAQKFLNDEYFEYDINNSIKNTHSRNGLIKFNENQYVYLGLENDGFEDTIYVRLEVVAIRENVKYYKLEKKKH